MMTLGISIRHLMTRPWLQQFIRSNRQHVFCLEQELSLWAKMIKKKTIVTCTSDSE